MSGPRERSGTRPARVSIVHARVFQQLLSVGVISTMLVGGACKRSAEDQRRVAEQATAEAEDKASQTTTTSAELDGKPDDQNVRDAQDRALRERAEAITATRSEQLEYRGKLQKALDELDAKRREAKKRGAIHVKAVDARRDVLKHDLDAIDRTTDNEWAATKAKIDRDLREHSHAAPNVDADADAEGK